MFLLVIIDDNPFKFVIWFEVPSTLRSYAKSVQLGKFCEKLSISSWVYKIVSWFGHW